MLEGMGNSKIRISRGTVLVKERWLSGYGSHYGCLPNISSFLQSGSMIALEVAPVGELSAPKIYEEEPFELMLNS